ncbi:MAG: hypothetical protein LBL49_07825 [Clostridiales Family XIII bacterium]|jgi:hypothetical protein|nr:hypothetical protein [Clostridiales Family XIII bacterium]
MIDVLFALEIYFLAFVIGLLIAIIIKVMLIVIRRLSPNEDGDVSKAGKPGKGGDAV